VTRLDLVEQGGADIRADTRAARWAGTEAEALDAELERLFWSCHGAVLSREFCKFGMTTLA
jgi:hypothetical protein